MQAFDKWWAVFEPQIDPDTYNGDEKEIRKAIARCTHRNTLRWVLSKRFKVVNFGCGTSDDFIRVEVIKKELDE